MLKISENEFCATGGEVELFELQLSRRPSPWIPRLHNSWRNIKTSSRLPGKFNQAADYLSRQPAVPPKCSVCAERIKGYDSDGGISAMEG